MAKDNRSGTLRLRRSLFPRWTRLDAYIFEEIHFPFAMAMLVFNGVFFIRTFGEVSELSEGRFEIPFDLLLVIFLSEIPEMLMLTTALSFLSAALIALGRLSADSEIIAPQAVGVSFMRLNRPVMTYAAILSMFLFFMTNWGAPRLKQLASYKTRYFFDHQALPNIQAGVITHLSSGLMLYVDHMDPQDPGMMGKMVMISRDEGREQLVLADKASIYTNRSFELRGVTTIQLDSDKTQGPELYDLERWEQPFPIPESFSNEQLKIEQYELFNTPQLFKLLQALKTPNYEVEHAFYSRLLNPLICMALALFAVPLAVRHTRLRKGSGLGTSIFLIAFYFILARTGKDAVEEGSVSASIGVGGPLLIYMIAGVILQIGKNRWWGRFFESKGRIRRQIRYIRIKIRRMARRSGRRRETPEMDEGGSTTSTFVFPSKLDIQVTRSFFSIYLLVQSSFLMLYLLGEYIGISESIRRFNPEKEVVVRYLLYKIPEVVDATMFICLLTAILIQFTIMSRNHEVTAVRAAGGSLYRLCLPLVLYGIAISTASFYMQNTFLPQMSRISAVYKDKIRHRNRNIFRNNVWLRTETGEIVNYGYFGDDGRLTDVNRYHLNPGEGQALTVVRDQQLQYKDGEWVVVKPGRSWRFEVDDSGELQPIPVASKVGEVCDLRLDTEDLSLLKQKAVEFSIAELREHLASLKQRGVVDNNYRTALYLKFAQPLVPFIMMLLAMPLGFQVGRRGSFYGVGVGLVAGMSFLGLLELFKKLGATGVLNPVTAAWSVVVMFGAVALYRYINMD
ncbi:MAG: LptF/LptG family permease [Acidobacteriota bacterium]|nr:LptF/LptG family permease [Acidobacteriota bacterium]